MICRGGGGCDAIACPGSSNCCEVRSGCVRRPSSQSRNVRAAGRSVTSSEIASSNRRLSSSLSASRICGGRRGPSPVINHSSVTLETRAIFTSRSAGGTRSRSYRSYVLGRIPNSRAIRDLPRSPNCSVRSRSRRLQIVCSDSFMKRRDQAGPTGPRGRAAFNRSGQRRTGGNEAEGRAEGSTRGMRRSRIGADRRGASGGTATVRRLLERLAALAALAALAEPLRKSPSRDTSPDASAVSEPGVRSRPSRSPCRFVPRPTVSQHCSKESVANRSHGRGQSLSHQEIRNRGCVEHCVLRRVWVKLVSAGQVD